MNIHTKTIMSIGSNRKRTEMLFSSSAAWLFNQTSKKGLVKKEILTRDDGSTGVTYLPIINKPIFSCNNRWTLKD